VLLWLPAGVVGAAVMVLILLSLVRWSEALVVPPAPPAPPPVDLGTVRLAAVSRTPEIVVVDGLVDARSALGARGAPVAFGFLPSSVDEASYQRLAGWVSDDAIIAVTLPSAPTASAPRPVDLRSGSDELRLSIAALSS
jgi:hypothetical protein